MTRKQDRSTIDTHDWKARIRPEIAHRAEYRCEQCGTFCGMHGHVDHVVSRAKGRKRGIDPRARDNLQYLCPSCHNAKSARERWEGHTPRDRSGEIRRSNVPGRAAFMHALREGIAINCKSEATP
ncbi:Restriction endonuclease [Marinovum algicola DG 898]|nr:Restriction endonuclease [Marinovum algicola DG 898]